MCGSAHDGKRRQQHYSTTTIATGHGPAHSLAIDHGLRPLFASLGATVVPSGVYGTAEQFADGQVAPELLRAVDRAVREAVTFAAAAID